MGNVLFLYLFSVKGSRGASTFMVRYPDRRKVTTKMVVVTILIVDIISKFKN
jgi:hypothetical protein